MEEICGGTFFFQAEEKDSCTAVALAGNEEPFDGGAQGGKDFTGGRGRGIEGDGGGDEWRPPVGIVPAPGPRRSALLNVDVGPGGHHTRLPQLGGRRAAPPPPPRSFACARSVGRIRSLQHIPQQVRGSRHWLVWREGWTGCNTSW